MCQIKKQDSVRSNLQTAAYVTCFFAVFSRLYTQNYTPCYICICKSARTLTYTPLHILSFVWTDTDRGQKHGMEEFISANPCKFDHAFLFQLLQRQTLDHRLNDSYSCLVSID